MVTSPNDEVRELWSQHAPGVDTSPMEIAGLVKAIQSVLERATEPLFDSAPLTSPELDVLITLRHDPEPTIARRLADRMRISRPAAGKTLSKLEKRGFIARTPSPTDRRAELIEVTAAGMHAVDTVFPKKLAIVGRLLEDLGDQRAPVTEALRALLTSLEQATT